MGTLPLVGWRSRGYLPHIDLCGAIQHVVFSLADAAPGVDAIDVSLSPSERRKQFDALLDASHGCCLLADHTCAAIVQDELLRLAGDRYRLLAWCVMPNHVHVVIEQRDDLAGTVRRWKSWTARKINEALKRDGPLWNREYFDRFARDEQHVETMINYVEANPVAAGLVATPEEWLWSSVRFRLGAG